MFSETTCHGNRLGGSRTGKPSKGPLKMRGVYDVETGSLAAADTEFKNYY